MSVCLYCFENGRTDSGDHHGRACRAYAAQVRYNRMFRRLLVDQGQGVRTVPPPPDYTSPAAVTARIIKAAKAVRWSYDNKGSPLVRDPDWYYRDVLAPVLRARKKEKT